VLIICVLRLSGLPLIFSISRNTISPPSITGSGRKLITARFAERKPRKKSRSVKLTRACSTATLTIPTGPATFSKFTRRAAMPRITLKTLATCLIVKFTPIATALNGLPPASTFSWSSPRVPANAN